MVINITRKLAIIGACGHGKVLADIAVKMEYEEIIFFDDYKTITEYGGYLVAGKSTEIEKYECDVAVAIGNPNIRQLFQEKIEVAGRNIPILAHPDAVIAKDTLIGAGTVIMAGAVISPGSIVGKGCIINTCSSVDHDCIIEDYVHIAVGAHLAGAVKIGTKTWIGAGAVVRNDIDICAGCMIGTGAVVVKNIETSGTYVGVPVREMQECRGE